MKMAFLSHAINAYLNLDPETHHRQKRLQGKVITIELLPFHFVFQCQFTSQGVNIATEDLLQAETTIRGTPLQMMGMALSTQNRQRFFAEDVLIEGNAELGQDVIALFDELHIDWEEYLSHLVGDVPAHHAGNLVKGVCNWLATASKSFRQNMTDYVHEEAEWFPQREALQDFFHDIDNLRMDVDRAEAKIRELKDLIEDHP